MASDERGTKRTCPVTGKKFYDLNKDPVVSPYTGKSYPVSFFQAAPEKPVKAAAPAKEPPAEDSETADVDVAAEAAGAEVISLSEAEPADTTNDDEDDDNSETIPDVEEVEDIAGGDDDSFLESDDDDEAIDFDVEVDNEDDR